MTTMRTLQISDIDGVETNLATDENKRLVARLEFSNNTHIVLFKVFYWKDEGPTQEKQFYMLDRAIEFYNRACEYGTE